MPSKGKNKNKDLRKKDKGKNKSEKHTEDKQAYTRKEEKTTSTHKKKKTKKKKQNASRTACSPLPPHPDESAYLIVSRNAYLEGEPLNLAPHDYGTNFVTASKDSRKRDVAWAAQRARYGFDERETWNLCVAFPEWLYSRLRMFAERVPLSDDVAKYELDGKLFTQKQAVETIISACESFIELEHRDEIGTEESRQAYENMQAAAHLWAELFFGMWW